MISLIRVKVGWYYIIRRIPVISQSKIIRNTVRNGSRIYDDKNNLFVDIDFGRELYEITSVFIASMGRIIYRYREYNFDDNFVDVQFLFRDKSVDYKFTKERNRIFNRNKPLDDISFDHKYIRWYYNFYLK